MKKNPLVLYSLRYALIMTFLDFINSQQTSLEMSTHCSTLFGILDDLTLVKGLVVLLLFSTGSSDST